MSFYANAIQLLSVATRITTNSTRGYDVGEYGAGTLFIRVQSLTSGSRLWPAWQESPNGNAATGGHYATIKTAPTSIQATGMAVMTLPVLGPYGRLLYTLVGTTPSVKFEAWSVFKGQF